MSGRARAQFGCGARGRAPARAPARLRRAAARSDPAEGWSPAGLRPKRACVSAERGRALALLVHKSPRLTRIDEGVQGAGNRFRCRYHGGTLCRRLAPCTITLQRPCQRRPEYCSCNESHQLSARHLLTDFISCCSAAAAAASAC